MLKVQEHKELVKGFPKDVISQMTAQDYKALNDDSELKTILSKNKFESHKELCKFLGDKTNYKHFYDYPLNAREDLIKTGCYNNFIIVCFGSECRYYEKEKL